MDTGNPTDPNVLIQQVLEEASGGVIKDVEGLKGFVTNFQTLQAKAAELETKASLDPFVNEFTKNTNEFFAKGGTTDEYLRFLEVSRLDPEKMAPIDLVRHDYRDRYPQLSPEEIDAKIRKDIGAWTPTKGEDGIETPVDTATSAELKVRAAEVAKKLADQKAKLATPVAALQAKDQEEREKQVVQGMQTLVNFAVKGVNKIPLKIADKDKEVFAFDFELPKEFAEEAMQAVLPLAVAAFKKGELSANQADFESKTLPVLQDWARSIAWMKHGQKLTELAIRDAIAKTRQEVAAKQAGMTMRTTQPTSRVPDDWKKAMLQKDLGRK